MSIYKELDLEYELHVLRQEAQALSAPHDQEQFRSISVEATARCEDEAQITKDTFDLKKEIEVALLSARHSIDLERSADTESSIGHSKLRAVQRMAERSIARDYAERIDSIRGKEAADLGQLLEAAYSRASASSSVPAQQPSRAPEKLQQRNAPVHRMAKRRHL